MSEYKIAFFIGLLGSVHCVGMCGPLAFAIPVRGARFGLLLWDKLIYNLGRVVTYSVLGLVAGLVGLQLWLSGMQQTLSLISGTMVILAALGRLFQWHKGNWALKAMAPVNRLMTFALQQRYGHLIIGMINGLLPCGFVYLALAGALGSTSYSAWSAVRYMFSFGMGTLPLMLLATVGSGYLNHTVRRYINKSVPYFMITLGIWFLLRGVQLNIPYLSPPKPNTGVSMCK